MRNSIGIGQIGDVDQAFGNQRSGNRRAKQIFTFINCVGAEHREDEIAHKLFAQIVDIDILRLDAEFQRLGARRLKLFTLTKVGGEGHHLTLIGILQPFQDD